MEADVLNRSYCHNTFSYFSVPVYKTVIVLLDHKLLELLQKK